MVSIRSTMGQGVEVTREMPARVVFEVLVDDPGSGWTVCRSERLPSLDP